ncbi:MAG: hypothetical protein ACKOEL_07040 [Planctomycetota bacterium]
MSDAQQRPAASPLTRPQVVDLYFMEHRARLLDVAAFLDRVDRAGAGDDDFRMQAFRRAVSVLQDGRPERARRILELLSDPSTEPIAKAGMKGATGAHDAANAPKGSA